MLLGLSMASTVVGYMVVWFDQGFGWGARYLHPAWGTLPILGAAALTLVREPSTRTRLRGYVASVILLSLVLATALRGAQIQGFVENQLSNLPPYVPDTRQIVFIRYDQENYTADLVQNDPYLRDKVWFLMSFGRQYDYLLMKSRFPNARQVSDDKRGSVWRLE
jgi:quinol-cytochrome oxidoreductase complex cytochrome b subunit